MEACGRVANSAEKAHLSGARSLGRLDGGCDSAEAGQAAGGASSVPSPSGCHQEPGERRRPPNRRARSPLANSAQPALVNRSAGGFVDRGRRGAGHWTSARLAVIDRQNREDRDQPIVASRPEVLAYSGPDRRGPVRANGP